MDRIIDRIDQIGKRKYYLSSGPEDQSVRDQADFGHGIGEIVNRIRRPVAGVVLV